MYFRDPSLIHRLSFLLRIYSLLNEIFSHITSIGFFVMSCTVTVVFPNDADAKYDIEYYSKNHMTLIEKHWSKFGLKSWSVTKYIPGLDGSPPAYAFGSEVYWESEEGMAQAFRSSEVAEIMADVTLFSNKPPTFLIGQIIKRASNF